MKKSDELRKTVDELQAQIETLQQEGKAAEARKLVAEMNNAVDMFKAAKAMEQLKKLRGCEMHVSVMLSHVDESLLKKLGVNLTSEPEHQGQKLYRKK